jgi:hypothetical protein
MLINGAIADLQGSSGNPQPCLHVRREQTRGGLEVVERLHGISRSEAQVAKAEEQVGIRRVVCEGKS